MKAFSSTTLLAFALSTLGANAITVKLYNNAGQSDEFAVNADGSCFDIHGGYLQKYNDNLQYMSFPSGYSCALWKDYGCNGAHSDAFRSNTGKVPISNICTNGNAGTGKWPGFTSSFKCCPQGSWCAGGQPGCT